MIYSEICSVQNYKVNLWLVRYIPNCVSRKISRMKGERQNESKTWAKREWPPRSVCKEQRKRGWKEGRSWERFVHDYNIILADDRCPFNNAFLFYENAISLQQNSLHNWFSFKSLWDGHNCNYHTACLKTSLLSHLPCLNKVDWLIDWLIDSQPVRVFAGIRHWLG